MPVDCQKLVILDTSFGFLGLVFKGSKVLHLSLGHKNHQELKRALSLSGNLRAEKSPREQSGPHHLQIQDLVDRLQRYTEGEVEEFRDVDLDLGNVTPFTSRVLRACQKIPYGKTVSYAMLAERAGSPRAARSAGSVMANNRFPLLVPCHRVVAAGRRLGGFSAPGGVTLKRQLLSLEASTCGVPLTVR